MHGARERKPFNIHSVNARDYRWDSHYKSDRREVFHHVVQVVVDERGEGVEGAVQDVGVDQIDTVVTVFADGKKISGSNDPLGVRRATLGILKTVLQKKLNVNITQLIKQAIDILPVRVEDKTKLFETIKEFFEQRLIVFMSDKYKHDVLEACISEKDVLSDLKDFTERLDILTDIVKKENYGQFHEAINRIIRLIKNEKEFATVDTALFKLEAEESLWCTVKSIDENTLKYSELENVLTQTIPFISEFFEEVLVMDNDEKIKNNRLAMLNVIRNKFAKIADFSKIVY